MLFGNTIRQHLERGCNEQRQLLGNQLLPVLPSHAPVVLTAVGLQAWGVEHKWVLDGV